MTLSLSSLLNFLGEHIYLVLIGCAELVLAVILLGLAHRPRSRGSRRQRGRDDGPQLLLQALNGQDKQVFVLLRREDLMPLAAAGSPELLGVTLEQLQADIASLLPQLKEPGAATRFWADYRAWDGTAPLTARLEKADGQWLGLTVSRSRDGRGDLFSFRVMTEEHLREAEFERRLSQAEEASQFKTSFLFRMSHEIRTPMNGITGMLTLAENRLPREHPAMQYMDKANELSAHLLSLINDILDMSRIEAGKVELESLPFSLRALGSTLYDMFAKQLDAAGIRYAVNFEDVTVDWVLGDQLRISQVIINFLSNAVKFTSKGEIIVTFRQMMLQNGAADLMIRVHDTGIGMDPEFLSRIFRPFEQEDISTTRRFGGTGLGMAISDQLVKLMGGQIVVESLPGVGSDFTVFLTLPVTEVPEEQAPEPAQEAASPLPESARGVRILMAEDNEVNAMVEVELLQARGALVDVAENGQVAVARFAASRPGYYDLILMDIQMPVMDGHAAARAIRQLDRPDAAAVPIYALSADAFVEDERLSRENGMNGHLTKPIDYEQLWHIIQDITRGKERGEP